MAETIIHVGTPGLAGVNPQWAYMETSEDFATITAPGFLNKVMNAGINLSSTTFVLAAYGDPVQVQQFNVIVDNSIFSLQVYSPGDNSFVYTDVRFVAKGGSDLNPGNTMGAPKLTISAAITAAAPSPSNRVVIWVTDGGTYEENVVLPFNTSLYMPNAVISALVGDAITINDSGINTVAQVDAASINSQTGFAIRIFGAQSVLFYSSEITQGDLYSEGALLFDTIALIESDIHIASTGSFGPQIVNAVGTFTETYDLGSKIFGKIGFVTGPDNFSNHYGHNKFLNKISFNQDELQETVGRTLLEDDAVSTIQLNSVTDQPYTLPQTSDVAIPIGAVVTFVQLGLGRANFIAGAGVTILNILGVDVSTSSPAAKAFAEKLTDTIWLVSGNIDPTSGP